MSKVNPEPNVIHIMGCYILGNPNGEKVQLEGGEYPVCPLSLTARTHTTHPPSSSSRTSGLS